MLDAWKTPEREQEPPYFGWLSTELPVYPLTTLNLKTSVHTQPVDTRPHIEVEPTDHPLPWSNTPASPSTGSSRLTKRSR